MSELFGRAGVKLSAAAATALAGKAVVFGKPRGKKIAVIETMHVVASEHLASAAASDEVLVGLLRHLAITGKRRTHTPAKLKDCFPEKCLTAFSGGLQERIQKKRWPHGIGAIRTGQSAIIFLLEDVDGLTETSSLVAKVTAARPTARGAPSPAVPYGRPGFAVAFDEAFDRLSPGRLLVKLSDLRAALPSFDRESFDRELRALRVQGRFVLDTFDGRHGEISPLDEAAAIREAGQAFVYVARRDHG